jgi:hypothetical protein
MPIRRRDDWDGRQEGCNAYLGLRNGQTIASAVPKTRLQHLKAAQKAGVKIKTAHPVVQVSVYDSVKGAKTIITAENV